MGGRPHIIRIAEIQNMKECIENLPPDLHGERQKLVELIKKSDGEKLGGVGYVVFTWDPELGYGETRLFTNDLEEIEI